MKQEYKLKQQVWIHLGEPKLVEGRVVEVIDLSHLNEGHSPDREFYIIELKTGIDDVYEVRDFDQISPDSKGPINLFRKLNEKQVRENKRYLKKVGMSMPIEEPNGLVELAKELNEEFDRHEEQIAGDDDEPTPEQIHAAIERAEKTHTPKFYTTNATTAAKKPRKRPFQKRKKNDASNT